MFTEVVGKIHYGVIILFVKNMKTLAVIALALVLPLSFAPSVSLAMGPEANATCYVGVAESEFVVPCFDTTFGIKTTEGICTGDNICTPLSTLGIGGGMGDVGLGAVGDWFNSFPGDVAKSAKGMVVGSFLGYIKTSLFGGPTTGSPTTGTPQCTGYYRVTVRTSDPCAIYVPPTPSLQIPQNTSRQLLDALKGPSVGEALLVQASKVGTPSPVPTAPAGQNQTPSPQSGAKGNIQLTSTSATIQAGVRDVARNTESVGFFGSNFSQGAQPKGLVERMCLLRPWQNPQISYGIPTSLFDNLCSSKGLRVGVLPGASTPALPSASAQAKAGAIASSTVPTNPPKVDIWAVPASVAVGSRTSIFWNTKGASSCTLSSSDGNFSAETVSGNSASAPLTGSTFFFISCIAPDGSRANGYVKVNIN